MSMKQSGGTPNKSKKGRKGKQSEPTWHMPAPPSAVNVNQSQNPPQGNGQCPSEVHDQSSTHAEGPNPRHSGSVKDFFKYDQYSYEPGLPIMTQYHRLRQHLGWSDPEAWREMDILQEAIVLEFNRAHGTDASVLSKWKNICQMLGARIPKTILECKATIRSVKFDLVDLALVKLRSPRISMYPDDVGLSKRITSNGQFDMGDHPLAGELLKEVVNLVPQPKLQILSKPHLIAAYFAHYHQFRYNRRGETWAQFRNLVDLYDWDEDTERYQRHRLRDALVQQFNLFYGTSAGDLHGWQDLCRAMKADVIPETIGECRGYIEQVHVNLVDLVDTWFTGAKVQKFLGEVELSEYTLETGKIFPKENAYAGELLRSLLRYIFHPRSGPRIGQIMQQRVRERRQARRAARRNIETFPSGDISSNSGTIPESQASGPSPMSISRSAMSYMPAYGLTSVLNQDQTPPSGIYQNLYQQANGFSWASASPPCVIAASHQFALMHLYQQQLIMAWKIQQLAISKKI